MTRQRYNQLMHNPELKLTDAELEDGWHFCGEWDGLLVHPACSEYEHCSCEGAKPRLPEKNWIDIFTR